VGLSQRKNIAKVFRAGRTQDQAVPIAKFAKTPMRFGSLPARPSKQAVAAIGTKWNRITVV